MDVGRSPDVSPQEAAAANRIWWDGDADAYQAEHGEFLGDADFLWCPEGVREADAGLLGEVRGRRVLEVGCGAAQCARWLTAQGAQPVAFDLSGGQLRHARRIGTDGFALLQADAMRLPFAAGSFDLACSAFGAVPFVTDSAAVMREVARVLRPGGRWVFSASHPIRWIFPDDGGPGGLTVRQSYFDRSTYLERDDDGVATYAEAHRTLGDRVAEIVGAGFALTALIEPEWPAGETRTWAQWTPLRGALFPGTAIFVCDLMA